MNSTFKVHIHQAKNSFDLELSYTKSIRKKIDTVEKVRHSELLTNVRMQARKFQYDTLYFGFNDAKKNKVHGI
jgi:hypothetical protein